MVVVTVINDDGNVNDYVYGTGKGNDSDNDNVYGTGKGNDNDNGNCLVNNICYGNGYGTGHKRSGNGQVT